MTSTQHTLAALTALLLLGAAALAKPIKPHQINQNNPNIPAVTLPALADGWGVMLKVDKSTYAGTDRKIQATLTLFNDTATPLTYTEHGQQVEWQILDGQGSVVWDYAKGRMFPHFVRLRSLAQGRVDHAEDIPLLTQDGAALPAGQYTLRGQIPGAHSSAEVGFTVTAGSQTAP